MLKRTKALFRGPVHVTVVSIAFVTCNRIMRRIEADFKQLRLLATSE